MVTLGGSLFVWNGINQDYCFIEALDCLYELCDEIAVIHGGSDGTTELFNAWCDKKDWSNKEIQAANITQEEWDAQIGREKLSYFSNLAIDMLSTDYVFNLQSDEIIHESSFPFMRQAIEEGQEGFIVTRVNLWGSPYSMLNVRQDRKPCSTDVIRLTKTKYRCIGDAESIGLPDWTNTVSFKYLVDIKIYHMGFVRDKYKHLTKIKHIQEKVFLWDVDKRIHDNTDGFNPWLWGFTPKDVVPIKEKLPKFIKEWAKERCYDPFNEGDENIARVFLSINNVMPEWRHPVLPIANYVWWRMMKK